MAFCWWAEDDPIFNIECWIGRFLIYQEIWTSIVKKPYRFVIFIVEGCVHVSGPTAPSGSAHAYCLANTCLSSRYV